MADFTRDCLDDLSRKKQGQATEGELRELFCGSCRNLECDRIETGPNDPMGKRARLQELRLLHPTIVDPTLAKFAPLAQQNFADAKEAAEAWDTPKGSPPIPDFDAAPVRPDLLAQRGAAPRKVLRSLPESLNTASRDTAPAFPSRAVAGPDPWDPRRGGMVVESGATVRLGASDTGENQR